MLLLSEIPSSGPSDTDLDYCIMCLIDRSSSTGWIEGGRDDTPTGISELSRLFYYRDTLVGVRPVHDAWGMGLAPNARAALEHGEIWAPWLFVLVTGACAGGQRPHQPSNSSGQAQIWFFAPARARRRTQGRVRVRGRTSERCGA
jgi:hypothetical protein